MPNPLHGQRPRTDGQCTRQTLRHYSPSAPKKYENRQFPVDGYRRSIYQLLIHTKNLTKIVLLAIPNLIVPGFPLSAPGDRESTSAPPYPKRWCSKLGGDLLAAHSEEYPLITNERRRRVLNPSEVWSTVKACIRSRGTEAARPESRSRIPLQNHRTDHRSHSHPLQNPLVEEIHPRTLTGAPGNSSPSTA